MDRRIGHRIFGDRVMKYCARCFNYVVYEKNPILLYAYFILHVSCFILYILNVFPYFTANTHGINPTIHMYALHSLSLYHTHTHRHIHTNTIVKALTYIKCMMCQNKIVCLFSIFLRCIIQTIIVGDHGDDAGQLVVGLLRGPGCDHAGQPPYLCAIGERIADLSLS